MKEDQLFIAQNYVEEDPKKTFATMSLDIVVGYYEQFFHQTLTLAEIEEAVLEGQRRLKADS